MFKLFRVMLFGKPSLREECQKLFEESKIIREGEVQKEINRVTERCKKQASEGRRSYQTSFPSLNTDERDFIYKHFSKENIYVQRKIEPNGIFFEFEW